MWPLTKKTSSVHLWAEVNICSKRDEVPPRYFWKITFTAPENIHHALDHCYRQQGWIIMISVGQHGGTKRILLVFWHLTLSTSQHKTNPLKVISTKVQKRTKGSMHIFKSATSVFSLVVWYKKQHLINDGKVFSQCHLPWSPKSPCCVNHRQQCKVLLNSLHFSIPYTSG